MDRESNRKRNELKQAYSGRTWATKVDKMNEQQVAAVYLRLKAQGKVT